LPDGDGALADGTAGPTSAKILVRGFTATEEMMRWRELTEGYPMEDVLRFVPGSDYALERIQRQSYKLSNGESWSFRWEEEEVWYEVYDLATSLGWKLRNWLDPHFPITYNDLMQLMQDEHHERLFLGNHKQSVLPAVFFLFF